SHRKPDSDSDGVGVQIGANHPYCARFLRRNSMYIVNAFWSIVPGNEQKAYAALGTLAAKIERSEPGTWLYLIHKPDLDPGINIYPPPAPVQVAFVEGYKDRDAFLAHHHGPNLAEFIAKYGALFLNMYGPASPFVIVQTL